MTPARRQLFWRIAKGQALALGLIAAGTAIRLAAQPVLGPLIPFASFYPAVLAAAVWGGTAAGLSALAMGWLAAWLFLVQTDTDHAMTQALVGLGFYTVCAGALVFIAHRMRAAEARLQTALARQELLFRELNHRTKNNFQIITNILRIQSQRADGHATRAELTQTMQRVSVIAELHEHFYRGDDIERVEFGDYLRHLCDRFRESLLAEGPVALQVQAESAWFDTGRAIPLGLAVNELLTNAVKYAFAPGQAGEIRVAFAADGDGWRLSIADNGRGMAAGAQPAGLGLRLVQAFVQQAGGEMEMVSQDGTRIEIRLG